VDARHKAGHDVLGFQKAECCNRILFPGQPCHEGGTGGKRLAF
jgi:hypothetical protein